MEIEEISIESDTLEYFAAAPDSLRERLLAKQHTFNMIDISIAYSHNGLHQKDEPKKFLWPSGSRGRALFLALLFLPALAPAQADLIKKNQDKADLAAQAEREKEAATRAADDGYWEALKDGDTTDCNKYLLKYPSGSYANEARRRKESLALKPNKATAAPEGFVFVPGGTYTMGDLFGAGESNETQHPVTVSDFYLGKTEVTFDDFDAFCAATGRTKPSDSGWGRGKRPVINVDWYDAMEYCNWLSQKASLTPAYTLNKTSKDPSNTNSSDSRKWIVTRIASANGYRLPTEAEWEYAAREGGKKVRFGSGKDQAKPSEINFDAKNGSATTYADKGAYRAKTVEVGSLQNPNALGLHDMSGNVWEWCGDWYGAYPTGSQTNPIGATSGAIRVLRGGSWATVPQCCRAVYRGYNAPMYQDYRLGFRVALAASFQ